MIDRKLIELEIADKGLSGQSFEYSHDTVVMPVSYAIDLMEAMLSKWIPVTERLPEEFTNVVLLDIDRDKKATGYYVPSVDRFFREEERKGNFFKTTHWMPLPNSPSI